MRIKIRDARQDAGLTQKELAKKVDLSQPYLAQIERGERKLSTTLQAQIAKVLDVAPSALVDFEAPSQEEEEVLLKVFRSLSPERRTGWIEMARAAAPQPRKDDE